MSTAPKMTDRQAEAWPEAIARVRECGVELSDSHLDYGWRIVWEEEVRPGRGQALSALWIDSDHIVLITMDVYGCPSVSVGDVNWIHSDSDEECACDLCDQENRFWNAVES